MAEALLALLLSLPPHGLVVRVEYEAAEVRSLGVGRVEITFGRPRAAVLRSPLGPTYTVPAGSLRVGDYQCKGVRHGR